MGPTYILNISICEDAKDAARQGFFYREPVYQGAMLERAVVVKDGMQSGKSSVDLIFRDKNGQAFVAIISSELLASIPKFE
jgi:hypothetical protein